MTSTSFNVGMSSAKSSSRVLKPPGGGHTNIFGSSEVKVNNPRPKYDQQNSSNLNFCMNTTDPNILVEQKKQEIAQKEQPANGGDSGAAPAATNAASKQSDTGSASAQPQQGGNRRVPPGGFSSGLW